MNYTLPKLNYSYDALEPYIDKETMEIHHSKHHAGYVENLNKALEGQNNIAKLSVEELLQNIDKVESDKRQTVINNAGGHANHTLYWEIMAPGESRPDKNLSSVINSMFGSLDNLKEKFSEKALTLFGSGWVFLTTDKKGKLEIKRHSFQNSPLMHRKTPILGIDVWEHAYYLKYQNRRADYIGAFLKVVNWEQVGTNLCEASK